MRTLFFAPHAGIWVHAFPEALIADALRSSGDDLVYITCAGTLSSFCITMASHGLTPDSTSAVRESVCRSCRRERSRLRRGFALPGYDMAEVLVPDDEAQIARILEGLDARNVADFELGGVAAGRATLYEYLIQRKKTRLEVDSDQWPEVKLRLANTLRSLTAATRIFDRERPDRVFTYNSLYSVNAMWRAVADQRGIPNYFLHAGSNLAHRLQTMIVARDSPLAWSRRLIAAWPRHRDQPSTPAELGAIGDHFEQLFAGTSVFAYSAAKATARPAIRAQFGVRPDQKLVLVTMSSCDEYIAAAAIGEMPAMDSQLFPTQIEWLQAVIPWLATRPDLALVIRVHPREFPNKREATKSEHALQLESLFIDLPPNVRINWPADKLSIYDLAEHADVVLNAWSSAGKEMALLGIPVVTYCPEMLLYPADLNFVGATTEDYFAAIERALAAGWSFERCKQAFRWWVLELVRSVADISDGYAFEERAPTDLLGRIGRLPFVREHLDLVRRPRHLDAESQLADVVHRGAQTLVPEPVAASADTTFVETAAIRAQLVRIARLLYATDTSEIEPGTLRARLAAALD